MKQSKINFINLLRNYKSGWVGISSDFKSVLFSGKTLKETMQKAKKTNKKAYFFPAGESYANFVGKTDNN